MTQTAEQLFHQAMQLSQNEREELADQLYLSLEATADSQEAVDSAWDKEIARRLAEVDAGGVALLSAEQIHNDISKILQGE